MIEVKSSGGYKRLIGVAYIVSVHQLSGEKRSKSVITLSTGETVFIVNEIEEVNSLIMKAQKNKK